MSKKQKPKMELYPIMKVSRYEHGKIIETFWEICRDDGVGVQFASYEAAEAYKAEGV